jgi:DNA-binding NarL/FixJ family response regulator
MRIVMIALIILAIALVIMIVVSQAYIRGIVASDRGKEQLLRLISKDLASPRSADSPAPDYATIRARCHELLGEDDGSMADEIASYITNLEEERSRRVKELGLTAREIEVIRLSAEGLSVAGIAERLHVSIYTIKNHKQNIYLKMDVRSNAEMLRLANELGIV